MFYRVITGLILASILLINTNSAEATDDDVTFINSFEEDLTGDGLREYVKLQGDLLSNDSNYFRTIWANIKGPFSQEWKISFPSGYLPNLNTIDFTHDDINELFFETAIEENTDTYLYQLYSLKNGLMKQIPLPEKTFIQGHFINDFKIEIRLAPNSSDLIIVDRGMNKAKYESLELYNSGGETLLNKQIISKTISHMEPILISKSKGYGLKSYQRVYGINEDDLIGAVETVWYYKQDKWIALQTHFHEK